MPRRATPLTVKGLERIKTAGLTADGNGLYFRVTPSGGRSWIWRYAIGASRHDMGLGPYPLVSLAAAREKAAELRRQKLGGVDPLTAKGKAKAAAAKAMTFRQCADAYIEAHRAGWRNHKSESQWNGSLAMYVNPIFGELPVQAVDTPLVMKALEPIWATKPETASRVRGRIEAILDWATVRGFRQGENPARWKGHLDNLLPKRSKVARVEHHPALPYAEIGGFMAELRRQEGAGARALEFAILTASRTGEVLGATGAEIDREARTWTIPGSRKRVAGSIERRSATPLWRCCRLTVAGCSRSALTGCRKCCAGWGAL